MSREGAEPVQRGERVSLCTTKGDSRHRVVGSCPTYGRVVGREGVAVRQLDGTEGGGRVGHHHRVGVHGLLPSGGVVSGVREQDQTQGTSGLSKLRLMAKQPHHPRVIIVYVLFLLLFT